MNRRTALTKIALAPFAALGAAKLAAAAPITCIPPDEWELIMVNGRTYWFKKVDLLAMENAFQQLMNDPKFKACMYPGRSAHNRVKVAEFYDGAPPYTA